MFKLIIQSILLIYLVLMVYHTILLQRFNINGVITEFNDYDKIKENEIILNPVITKHTFNFDINNSRYEFLQDIINYKNKNESYVFKNFELFEKIVSDDMIFNFNIFDDSYLYFPIYKSITIITGKNSIPLKKCIHNKNIIGVLEGSAIIYLFNPKHKDEILNKQNNEIKKWGHKKFIKKGDILIIPPHWSYIEEIEDSIIQYHIDIDTYMTCVPNYIKDT